MSYQLNRREFLLSLIAIGASFVLPANATPTQVDEVWQKAIDQPWYFTVNDWGTITDPNFVENEQWADIFHFETSCLRKPDDIIDTVNGCQPLINHFQSLATCEAEVLKEELDFDPPPRLLRQRHIRTCIQAIETDPDEGWQDWVSLEGNAGLQRFKDEIDNWLIEPADYSQSEWFPINHGSQGQAKAFFEVMEHDIREALCVVIVEGDHPGSSYYAAELRQDIEDANSAAEELGLPFRFKSENA